MEKSIEKSQEEAAKLLPINVIVQSLDIEYLKEISKDMIDQAIRQDTLSILRPNYDTNQSRLLEKQAKALRALCEYHDLLHEAEEIKKKIKVRSDQQEEINKLFV